MSTKTKRSTRLSKEQRNVIIRLIGDEVARALTKHLMDSRPKAFNDHNIGIGFAKHYTEVGGTEFRMTYQHGSFFGENDACNRKDDLLEELAARYAKRPSDEWYRTEYAAGNVKVVADKIVCTNSNNVRTKYVIHWENLEKEKSKLKRESRKRVADGFPRAVDLMIEAENLRLEATKWMHAFEIELVMASAFEGSVTDFTEQAARDCLDTLNY